MVGAVATLIGDGPSTLDVAGSLQHVVVTLAGVDGVRLGVVHNQVLVEAHIAVVRHTGVTTSHFHHIVGVTERVQNDGGVCRNRFKGWCSDVHQRDQLLCGRGVATIVCGCPCPVPSADATTAHENSRNFIVKCVVTDVRSLTRNWHVRGVVHHVEQSRVTRQRCWLMVIGIFPDGCRSVHQNHFLSCGGHVSAGIHSRVSTVEDDAICIQACAESRIHIFPRHRHHSIHTSIQAAECAVVTNLEVGLTKEWVAGIVDFE